jgi:transcriptional regulator with XRE-family HTH domain
MTALHTKSYRRFATALADARRDAGLSQYDLADRLKVDQSFISKYESARRRLDVIEFMRIIQAIGVSPAAFLDRLGPVDLDPS